MTEEYSEAFEEWASEEGINNFHFNHCWAAWQAALASVSAEPPEGWKLVPIESTIEMDSAGFNELYGEDARLIDAEACYRAMLEAAPTPPSSQPGRSE